MYCNINDELKGEEEPQKCLRRQGPMGVIPFFIGLNL